MSQSGPSAGVRVANLHKGSEEKTDLTQYTEKEQNGHSKEQRAPDPSHPLSSQLLSPSQIPSTPSESELPSEARLRLWKEIKSPAHEPEKIAREPLAGITDYNDASLESICDLALFSSHYLYAIFKNAKLRRAFLNYLRSNQTVNQNLQNAIKKLEAAYIINLQDLLQRIDNEKTTHDGEAQAEEKMLIVLRKIISDKNPEDHLWRLMIFHDASEHHLSTRAWFSLTRATKDIRQELKLEDAAAAIELHQIPERLETKITSDEHRIYVRSANYLINRLIDSSIIPSAEDLNAAIAAIPSPKSSGTDQTHTSPPQISPPLLRIIGEEKRQTTTATTSPSPQLTTATKRKKMQGVVSLALSFIPQPSDPGVFLTRKLLANKEIGPSLDETALLRIGQLDAVAAYKIVNQRAYNQRISTITVKQLVCTHKNEKLTERVFADPWFGRTFKFKKQDLIDMARANSLAAYHIINDKRFGYPLTNEEVVELVCLHNKDSNQFIDRAFADPLFGKTYTFTRDNLVKMSMANSFAACKILNHRKYRNEIDENDVVDIICDAKLQRQQIIDSAFEKRWFGKNFEFDGNQLATIALANPLSRKKILGNSDYCTKLIKKLKTKDFAELPKTFIQQVCANTSKIGNPSKLKNFVFVQLALNNENSREAIFDNPNLCFRLLKNATQEELRQLNNISASSSGISYLQEVFSNYKNFQHLTSIKLMSKKFVNNCFLEYETTKTICTIIGENLKLVLLKESTDNLETGAVVTKICDHVNETSRHLVASAFAKNSKHEFNGPQLLNMAFANPFSRKYILADPRYCSILLPELLKITEQDFRKLENDPDTEAGLFFQKVCQNADTININLDGLHIPIYEYLVLNNPKARAIVAQDSKLSYRLLANATELGQFDEISDHPETKSTYLQVAYSKVQEQPEKLSEYTLMRIHTLFNRKTLAVSQKQPIVDGPKEPTTSDLSQTKRISIS